MFTVVLLILNALLPQNTEHLLNSGWKFQQAGKTEWMDARVPGSVYADLYLNKKIGHPYKGTNEKELQLQD
jgi:beta-mannosidase